MKYKITLLPGDGIGPEVMSAGAKVLRTIGDRFGHEFDMTEAIVGGIAIDETGSPLPEETLEQCRSSDAVLLSAVGGPKWSDPLAAVRPEQGLLGLRKGLELFANIRPVKSFSTLTSASPLRAEIVRDVDIVIVRELIGGVYFGRPQGKRITPDDKREAFDTMVYSEEEVARLLQVAYQLARQRRHKVTSVDKANILASSRLWREVAHEVSRQYPDVESEDVLVDACAMYLMRRPKDFDVIAASNLFGDILSDEASVLSGSMGMLPSASLGGKPAAGETWFGLYEPVHGSAPDIAGKGIANPLATILSVAMMLRISFGLAEEADAVEGAVEQALKDGYRTLDIMSPGMKEVGTVEMTDAVLERV